MNTAQDYRKYLDPTVLAKLGGLELRARLIVEGFFMGMHRSPHLGLSVEYADHRAYTQGDDVRHIDWKVYGKTDKYYIKQYEQEANLSLVVAIDVSESMRYRSREELLTKFDYGASLAAATAYMTLQQQDSVGLALFDDRLVELVRPSNSAHHWRTIVKELSTRGGRAKTSVGPALEELAERLQHRTLILVISDLFDDPDSIIRGLKRLRHRHHELIVWNIWDPAEVSLPFSGPTMFDGLESTGRLMIDPRGLRTRYREEVERFRKTIRAECGRMQIDCTFFDTATPLDAALSAYFVRRSARLRTRSSRVAARG